MESKINVPNFIYRNVVRHIVVKGYTETQANKVADAIVLAYQRNQLDVPGFLREAEAFAKSQFGWPARSQNP